MSRLMLVTCVVCLTNQNEGVDVNIRAVLNGQSEYCYEPNNYGLDSKEKQDLAVPREHFVIFFILFCNHSATFLWLNLMWISLKIHSSSFSWICWTNYPTLLSTIIWIVEAAAEDMGEKYVRSSVVLQCNHLLTRNVGQRAGGGGARLSFWLGKLQEPSNILFHLMCFML